MKHFRLITVFLVLALLAALVPAGMAQDDTLGLSGEDFTFWTDAIAQSAESDNLAYNFTLDFNLDAAPNSMAFSLDGEGVISESGLFSLNVTGDIPAGDNGALQPVNFELRVVDDMIYVNLGEGWQGGTAEEVVSGLGETFGGMTGLDPEALAEGDMSGMMAMPGMMEGMAALGDLDINDYVTVERLDDADGQAHFSTEILVADLLSSDAFAGILGGAVAGQMGGGAEMSDEQLQQMGAMVGMMFADVSLTYDQYISNETGLVERGVLVFDLPLSGAMTGGEDVNLNLNFDINLEYPESVDVTAPESFEPFDTGS
jgi:hypothetical protein